MKISACVITKNEEKNIARCIESFKQWVNEIIVVDTGSNDSTAEIARSLGAKVYFFEWQNDFSLAKNYALSKAKGDWIVFLDADEYFGLGNVRKIIKDAISSGAEGIFCQLINIDTDNNKVIDAIYQVRIFKNSKLIRYQNSIHESLSKKTGQKIVGAMVSPDALKIFHTGYSSSVCKSKLRRNLALLLKQPDPGKEGIYYYIADCYIGLKDYKQALEYIKLHFASKYDIRGLNVKAYQIQITSMIFLDYEYERINAVIQKGISKFPDHPIFYYYLGANYFHMKKYREAVANFRRAIKLNQHYTGYEINNMPAKLFQTYMFLGIISECQNDNTIALEWYVASLKENKFTTNSLNNLLDIIRNQSTEEIVVFLKAFYKIEEKAELVFLMNALRGVKLGKILIYFANRYMAHFKDQDGAGLNLVYALIASGEYEKACSLLLDSYSDEANYLVFVYCLTALLLCSNPVYIGQVLTRLSPEHQKVVKAYYGIDNSIVFTEADIDFFLSVLEEFIFMANKEQIDHFVSLKDKFESDITQMVADKFAKSHDYLRALEEYFKYTTSYDFIINKRKGEILRDIGYCFYKLKDYKSALEYFELAVKEGYDERDINEFSYWIDACKG